MTLKNAVNELMDYAKVHNCVLHVAYAKKSYEIKNDDSDYMKQSELDEAKAFLDKNYNIVVDARKTGDETDYDEALALWKK